MPELKREEKFEERYRTATARERYHDSSTLCASLRSRLGKGFFPAP